MTDLKNKIYTILNEEESGLLKKIISNDHKVIIPHNGRGIALSLFSKIPKHTIFPETLASQQKLIEYYNILHKYVDYIEQFSKENNFDLLMFNYEKGDIPNRFYELDIIRRKKQSHIGMGFSPVNQENLIYFINFYENNGFEPLKNEFKEVQKMWERYNKSTIGGLF